MIVKQLDYKIMINLQISVYTCTKINCIMIVKQLVYTIMINLQISVYTCTKLNCIIE